MRRRRPSELDALTRKVNERREVAGGEELLEGPVRKGELSLAVLLSLADEQPRALLDVVNHHAGLVGTAVQQRPKGVHESMLGDVGKACMGEKLLTVGAGENVLRLLPPLNVTDAELSEATARLSKALTNVAKASAQG